MEDGDKDHLRSSMSRKAEGTDEEKHAKLINYLDSELEKMKAYIEKKANQSKIYNALCKQIFTKHEKLYNEDFRTFRVRPRGH